MNRILVAGVFLLVATCQGAFAAVGARISGAGATQAENGQFPWQVRLISYGEDGKAVYCSGVLFHELFVLTAAQCIKEKNVVVQLNSTLSSPCGDDVVRVLSEEIFIHPNYTSEEGLVLNDIAVIRLAHQVPLSDGIEAIALPSSDDYVGGNENVTVSGWGQSPDPNHPTLMYAETKTITNEECKKYFYEKNVVDGTLCTKSENSPCYGDGGSGLVQYVDGKAVVVGIVAFIPKDRCYNGGPAGYMRVSYYRDWISSSIIKFYEA